jgi:hypothetical protein
MSFFCLLTLRSARVSILVIVLSDTLHERIGKWKTCLILKEDFSWNICDKNGHIIRCIESNSFYDYVGIHDSSEDIISKKEQWVKINTDTEIVVH